MASRSYMSTSINYLGFPYGLPEWNQIIYQNYLMLIKLMIKKED